MRFNVDEAETADSAYLVFKDDNGKQLSKADAAPAHRRRWTPRSIDKLRGGKFNDLWSQNIQDDGRIKMTNEGGAWTALVNNPDKLAGLHYEFQVFDKDAAGQAAAARRHEPGREVHRPSARAPTTTIRGAT